MPIRFATLTCSGRIALPDIITMRKRPRNTEAECVGLYTPANALGAINHPEENAVDHAMKRAAKLLSTTDQTPGFVGPQRSMTGDDGAPHELKSRLDSALSCLSWQISSFTEKITQMLCPEVELSSSWLVNIRAASAEFKEMYERLSAAYYQCFLQVQRESRDEVRQQMIAEITAMAIQ